MNIEVEIDEKGRITIPVEIRSQLHLKTGERLIIQVIDDGISLRPTISPEELIKKARKFRSGIKNRTNKPVGFEKLFKD